MSSELTTVAEAEGGATQVLEASDDGLGGTVGRSGAVEVGQDVGRAGVEGPPEGDELGQRARNALFDGHDELRHQRPASGAVGFAVGGDHALVDALGGLDLDVLVGGEQGCQPVLLLVGEQVRTGVQGPPCAVERVVGAAAMPVEVLLDASAAAVPELARLARTISAWQDQLLAHFHTGRASNGPTGAVNLLT